MLDVEAKRSLLLVALWALIGGVVGCGPSRLSPTEACSTLVERGVRCGTYHVGSYGGTTMAEDEQRCASAIRLLNDHCQDLASQLAQCGAGQACDSTACQDLLNRFTADCSI